MTILDEIMQECLRQDKKWGRQDHSPECWLAILGEEFGEVAREVTRQIPPIGFVDGVSIDEKPDMDNYRKELIQLAAVALRMVESYDRNGVTSARAMRA